MDLSINRHFLFWGILCCGLHVVRAQQAPATISLEQQLRSFHDIATLPGYRPNTIVAQVSSYDTTGGNNDGFNGKYSFVRKLNDSSLVLFDVKGPGAINRIWTPTPSSDTLDFYIDDNGKPAFSINYMDLFSNKVYPFILPLCGNELGGFYCYLPIPFKSSCRIICRAKETKFHQLQYTLFAAGTIVRPFSMMLNPAEKAAVEKIGKLWRKAGQTAKDFYTASSAILTSAKTVLLRPGETETIFNMEHGGRIVGITLDDAAMFEGLANAIDIRITWDGELSPAVYCPVADFFGYAFGKASMQALLLGTKANSNYAFFPMPFDRKAKIELLYRNPGYGKYPPVRINALITYSNQVRDVKNEGRFYSCWRSNLLPANSPAHVFLNARGRGHYVGSILQAQGLRPGMTYFFEGDDSTATDELFRIHGTGSEDYFNGGWYAFPDRWSGSLSLPLHGALDYSLPFCRTGGYRFYMNDKIPFENSIYFSIEHGPERNSIPVKYSSLAFYYADRAPGEIVIPTNELSHVYQADTMIMYPQLMKFVVWDNISVKGAWKYDTGGETFLFTATDESRIKVSLDELPDGRYTLFADITKDIAGCSFSLWQGQNQLTEWINTQDSTANRVEMLSMGQITIREFYRSLTIRFRTTTRAQGLSLSRLIFVRRDND